ncbi:hypothetical protein GCM10023336_57920 [Streptomyces similanensis]|uniref:Uncharacterized protein n=1 Tax=Streptomyces similanensis TaxID=1274988 RepID=A0ABP9L9M6_9ACTN
MVPLPAASRPSAQHKPSPPPLQSYDADGARNVHRGAEETRRRAEACVTSPYEVAAGGQARGSTACGTRAPAGEFLQLDGGARRSSAGGVRAGPVPFLGLGARGTGKNVKNWTRGSGSAA